MSEEKKKTIFFVLLGVFLIGGLIYNTLQKEELYKNLKYTEGEVIDFSFSNNSYLLEYSYFVEGKRFTGVKSVGFFKCKDGQPGCKGKKFRVKYSSENPKNSEIDLEEYNKHKDITPSL